MEGNLTSDIDPQPSSYWQSFHGFRTILPVYCPPLVSRFRNNPSIPNNAPFFTPATLTSHDWQWHANKAAHPIEYNHRYPFERTKPLPAQCQYQQVVRYCSTQGLKYTEPLQSHVGTPDVCRDFAGTWCLRWSPSASKIKDWSYAWSDQYVP